MSKELASELARIERRLRAHNHGVASICVSRNDEPHTWILSPSRDVDPDGVRAALVESEPVLLEMLSLGHDELMSFASDLEWTRRVGPDHDESTTTFVRFDVATILGSA